LDTKTQQELSTGSLSACTQDKHTPEWTEADAQAIARNKQSEANEIGDMRICFTEVQVHHMKPTSLLRKPIVTQESNYFIPLDYLFVLSRHDFRPHNLPAPNQIKNLGAP